MRNLTLKFTLILILLTMTFTGFGLELAPADGFSCAARELYGIATVPPLTVSVEDADGVPTLNYKLFDIFNLKSVRAKVLQDNYVYLGGIPVGITVRAEGVIIAGLNNVVTSDGLENPLEGTDIRVGDVLTEIDGEDVRSAADIATALKKAKGNVELTVNRAGETYSYKVMPAADVLSGSKKLGLSVKENVSGIGTLTYVTDDGAFGALGHRITDSETGLGGDDLSDGKLFYATIFGVVKGKKGEAGELRGAFNMFDKGIGVINKNNNFGIFGTTTMNVADLQAVEVGAMSEVKPGKAQILPLMAGLRNCTKFR